MIESRVRNIPIWLHNDEALSNAIRRSQDFWEGDILDYIRDNFPVQKVIFDVGANVGNHSLYFATFLEYTKIVAFEPYIESFKLLQMNLNRFDSGRVLVYQQGISDQQEWTNLVINHSNLGANEIHPDAVGERVYVNTLNEFGTWFHPVTLIKIDAEWWEPQVLAGANEIIQRDHPLILIEDSRKEYGKLLPDYDLHMGWEWHNTYLYKWRE